MLNIRNPKSIQDLINIIRSENPALYHCSQTSTVIPYDKLEQHLKISKTLVNLSSLPKNMKLTENHHLQITGPINWLEAKQFLKNHRRTIMTSPTEELAAITAGIATSCTGERCFGFGNMRAQVRKLKYLDYQGEIQSLSHDQEIDFVPRNLLNPYQEEFTLYQDFKNAPFPRFEKMTDLMIGTEGQLGIITEVELITAPDDPVRYFFIKCPKWTDNFEPHLEIFQHVQNFRNEILSVELLDYKSINYLDPSQHPVLDADAIFLEIKEKDFDKITEEFFYQLKLINMDSDIFEISENKFHQIRMNVPRAIFEHNSKMGVEKMGTDVQVSSENFSKLLSYYQTMSQVGIGFNLFGHFGDAHLHFNYMPTPEQVSLCQKEFAKLYQQVLKWRGSPFAEHGIGLLKKPYISPFHNKVQKDVFEFLKSHLDPKNYFFPDGFMSW